MEKRMKGRVDLSRLNATTDAEIEHQANEDGGLFVEFPPVPAAVRRQLGMTQQEIADFLRIPVGTWRNWEQGRTMIDAPGQALLFVLAREPAAVRRALRRQAA